MSAQASPPLTPEEYLALERKATVRSEYHRGVMLALAGTTLRHGQISRNLLRALDEASEGTDCEVFASDIRLWIEAAQLYTYPNLMIICGELETTDPVRDTVTNPSTIVEILSRSTEAYDRGRKFTCYQQIASLKEYVLVSQEEPRVERFVRMREGSWNLAIVSGLDAELSLRNGAWTIPLSAIYRRVAFESNTAQ